jgi:hypothetical protein
MHGESFNTAGPPFLAAQRPFPHRSAAILGIAVLAAVVANGNDGPQDEGYNEKDHVGIVKEHLVTRCAMAAFSRTA